MLSGARPGGGSLLLVRRIPGLHLDLDHVDGAGGGAPGPCATRRRQRYGLLPHWVAREVLVALGQHAGVEGHVEDVEGVGGEEDQGLVPLHELVLHEDEEEGDGEEVPARVPHKGTPVQEEDLA